MNPSPARAEVVFARAIELPAGAARNAFVAKQCAGDPALRRDVESLLRAHDEAGDFLLTRAERKTKLVSSATAVFPQRTTAINAAALAEAFLHDADEEAGKRVEDYIATLPEAVRREAVRQPDRSRNCPDPNTDTGYL